MVTGTAHTYSRQQPYTQSLNQAHAKTREILTKKRSFDLFLENHYIHTLAVLLFTLLYKILIIGLEDHGIFRVLLIAGYAGFQELKAQLHNPPKPRRRQWTPPLVLQAHYQDPNTTILEL